LSIGIITFSFHNSFFARIINCVQHNTWYNIIIPITGRIKKKTASDNIDKITRVTCYLLGTNILIAFVCTASVLIKILNLKKKKNDKMIIIKMLLYQSLSGIYGTNFTVWKYYAKP